jgi:hypothetical protein
MSSFTLTFSTDGAAFADDHAVDEIARLLRDAADTIDYNITCADMVYRLSDVNGNRVGFFIHNVDSVLADAQ